MSTPNIYLSTINGAPYIPGGGGGSVVSSFTNLATSSFTVSSINGAPYTPGGGGGGSFVSTATSDLNMSDFNITSLSSITANGDLSINSGNNFVINSANQLLTFALTTINDCGETSFTGSLKRLLRGVYINQPIIQYGYVSTTGASGNLTVNIPTIYSSQNSYIPFAVMVDAPPSQINVSSISRGSFIIGWSSGGSGSHKFAWNTMGT